MAGRGGVTEFNKVGAKRFVLVGALGFAVDFGIFAMCLGLGTNVYLSRLLSFVAAVTSTFTWNRAWTFRDRVQPQSLGAQLAIYGLSQTSGAVLSLIVYVALFNWVPNFDGATVVFFSTGSAVALVFNYYISAKFVFSAKMPKKDKLR